MAEESAKLRIPYMAAAQAQKHVTHNEGMTLLDTLVQLSVIDKDLNTPPGSPVEGDTYIVAASATGAWIGWDTRIARFIDGEWRSYLPGAGAGAGWLAWVMDEDAMYRFDGAAWALAGIEGPVGPPGSDPGVLFTFDTDTADSDPGAGDIKANNAALGSATALYVSKTSRGGSSIAAFLLSLDDSTTASRRGILVLTRTSDEAQATFDVGAVTDATGYVKVDVSNHSGTTGFTAADPISFQFWATGDSGGAGGFNDLEGEWSAGATYDDLDVVSYLGSSYVSIGGGNIANQPDTSPGNWLLLAAKGEPGGDGADPGILLTWADDNADSDPGAGAIKADDDALGSATKLYVSKTSRGASDIAAFLLGLADSTNPSRKGVIVLTRTADDAQAIFDLDAVTDATGYVKIDISGHAGATAFTAADPISFQVSRDGDKGADGVGTGDVVGPDSGVTDGHAALFDGTTGKLVKSAGAPPIIESLLTTRGDIVYRNATVPARLAKGTQYQVLQAGANDPAYDAVHLDQAAAVTGVLPAANLPDASTSAKGVSELATAAEYRTGTDTGRVLVVDQVWSAASLAVLTDGANIAVDLAAGFNFGGASNAVLALGGNRTLDAPSNLKTGQAGVLWFGAATSTRTLTLNAAWLLMDGIEVGPYSITTAQILGVACVVRASVVYVTAILRRAA